MTEEQIVIRRIGHVRNPIKEVKPMRDAWKDIVSEVVLEPALADGLQGLDVLPHLKLLPKPEVCLKIAVTQRLSFPLRSDGPSAALSRPGTRREPAEPGLDDGAIMRPGGARKRAWTVTLL